MKRIISILLLSFFMLTALVSCGNKIRQFHPTSNETETPTAHLPEYIERDPNASETVIPTDPYSSTPIYTPNSKLDFEGLELRILSRTTDRYMREWGKTELDYGVEDMVGYELTQRNEEVAELLNLDFKVDTVSTNKKWEEWAGMQDMWTAMTENYSGGKYHIYAHSARGAAEKSVRYMFVDLLDTGMFPNFDFSKLCWNQSMINQAIDGKLQYVTGDINLSLFDNTVVMWHNKTLYDHYKTESDPQDLQDLALEGNFDFDTLYRWSALVELYGKGSIECENTYGMTDLNNAFYDAIPYAWELEMIKTNSNGWHTMNVDDNIKVESALADLRDFRSQMGISNCPSLFMSSICKDGLVGHFVNGQALFMANTLSARDDVISEANAISNGTIRDMSDQYCVLPMPKYNLEQKEYKTTSITDFNVMSVPNHGFAVGDGDAISAFLQYASEISYNDIRGYYIEAMVVPRFYGSDMVMPRFYGSDEGGTLSKSIIVVSEAFDNITFDTVSVYGAALSQLAWNFEHLVEYTNKSFEESFYSSQSSPFNNKSVYENLLKDLDNYMFYQAGAKG